MEKISEQMHNTGYGTAVVGTGGPDTNYGLAQCYGPGDKAVCGNTTRRSTNFQAAAKKVVWSAVQAAPNNEGYAREEVSVAGTANDSAYVLLIVGGVWTQEGRALNTGCFMRYSDRDFLNKEQEKGSSEDNVLVIVVAVVSSVIVLVVGIAIVAYIRKHRYIQMKRRVSQELHHNSLNFKYSLEKATNSFDEVNRLGQGGFGTGVLADGREIAIKTLYFNNRHKAADFYNKVNIISSVEHKNLVRLLGCSCSGPESLLIYEYLPNRSLDRFIFGNNSTHEIDCLISDSKIPPFHDMEAFSVRDCGTRLLCTQEIPSLRPSMSKALKMPTKKEEHLELEAPSNPPFIHESTMELHD
ncbi:Cysteine-rich receptor-like protein kinase 2 [Glycine max]|nr:Cysteine-rich receptor-like protein kinase 2 [Glycine max]